MQQNLRDSKKVWIGWNGIVFVVIVELFFFVSITKVSAIYETVPDSLVSSQGIRNTDEIRVQEIQDSPFIYEEHNKLGGQYHDEQQQKQQQHHQRRRRSVSKHRWSVQSYPIPDMEPDTCGTKSGRFCDPDRIIVTSNIENSTTIDRIETLLLNSDNPHPSSLPSVVPISTISKKASFLNNHRQILNPSQKSKCYHYYNMKLLEQQETLTHPKHFQQQQQRELLEVDHSNTPSDNDSTTRTTSTKSSRNKLMEYMDQTIPIDQGYSHAMLPNPPILPVQYGVALLRTMDLKKSSLTSKGQFAQALHDKWGVGSDFTSKCLSNSDTVTMDTSEVKDATTKLTATSGLGSGVLLLLSINDRFVYISRGALLEHVLTDRRLDIIMNDVMKPYLRQGLYGEAIIEAIQQLDHYLLLGEPNWKEKSEETLNQYGGIVIVLTIFGIAAVASHIDGKERAKYALVASRLDEIDQARAEALRGQFQAKSCPICLEPFIFLQQTHEGNISTTSNSNGNKRNQVGNISNSNDHSHNASGISGSIISPTLASPQPIQDLTNPSNPNLSGKMELSPSQPHQSELVVVENNQQEQQHKATGSDGLPLKLLRCGHVFDTSCWEEWVASGQKTINKCPICQQDVGSAGMIPSNTSDIGRSNRNQSVIRRNTSHTSTTVTDHQFYQDNNNENTDSSILTQRFSEASSTEQDGIIVNNNEVRSSLTTTTTTIMNQFVRERNFRLLRLAERYPQYIQQHHLQRWTSGSYDGGPLARDPTFVRNNPENLRTQTSSRTNGNNCNQRSSFRSGGSSTIRSGFGGGSSGGGRGSSW